MLKSHFFDQNEVQYVISARTNLEIAWGSKKVTNDDDDDCDYDEDCDCDHYHDDYDYHHHDHHGQDLDGNICVPPLARTDDAKVASANLLQIPYFQP